MPIQLNKATLVSAGAVALLILVAFALGTTFGNRKLFEEQIVENSSGPIVRTKEPLKKHEFEDLEYARFKQTLSWTNEGVEEYSLAYPKFASSIDLLNDTDAGGSGMLRIQHNSRDPLPFKFYLQATVEQKPLLSVEKEIDAEPRGWVKEEPIRLQQGLEAAFYSADLKRNPKPGQDCTIGYAYHVSMGKKTLNVLLTVSQDAYNSRTSSFDGCQVYTDPYYGYIQKIRERIQSSFEVSYNS